MHQELTEPPEKTDTTEHPALKENEEQVEAQVIMEPKDMLEHQVEMEEAERRVLLDHPDTMVPKVIVELLEHQEQMVGVDSMADLDLPDLLDQ